jgi:hypothetical protein
MVKLRNGSGDEDSFGAGLDRENGMNGHGVDVIGQGPLIDPGMFGIPEGGDELNRGASHVGTTPRENASVQMRPPMDQSDHAPGQMPGGGGESHATPMRPPQPTPEAGSSFQATSGGDTTGQGGLTPFSPLPQTDYAPLARSGGPGGLQSGNGGLFGSLGGLQGGGLGVPLDPTANEQSDPIDTLIKHLMMTIGRR